MTLIKYAAHLRYKSVFDVQKDLSDVDRRTALHRAAMNGRLLAVSFLLGIAADPNALDRWGNTPLDLALLGDSSYHMFEISHDLTLICN